MNKAIKYKLKPTHEQVVFFEKNFGCARFVWNQMLGVFKENFDNHSYYINDTIKMFKVINRDKTLKDFYDTLKTTTMEELHEKYKLIYQAITNAKIEQEYQEVISQLNVQEYDNEEFSITIPKTTQDIINEGKALHYCVGVYVDKVVRREDMIYFLRKDINTPYVTIEVKDKKVTQIEGDMNNRFIGKDTPEYKAIKEWARVNKFTLL